MRRLDPLLIGVVLASVFGCSGGDESPLPSHAEAVASCAAASILNVDLDAWRQALEAIERWPIDADELVASLHTAPDYNPVLAQLRLLPLPDRSMETPMPEQGVMSLGAVDITDLQRGFDQAADKLVAARFRNAAGAESLRAVVLRPIGAAYCSLGDDLSHEKESGEEPCIEQHKGFARSLRVEQLVAPDRDAIEVRDAGGWCGSGTQRGDKYSTAYWGIEQARLVRYFEGVTFQAWYESPDPPVKIRRGEIALSQSWPKAITFTEIVECMPDEDGSYSIEDCQSSEQTSTYHYIDNQYVAYDESTAASDPENPGRQDNERARNPAGLN